MKFSLSLLVLLALAPYALAGDDPSETLPGIADLTPDNFNKLVNGGKHALVEFYAPWCGHCKRMVPELKKLGELLDAEPKIKSRVVVGKVNADAHRSLGEKFGVRGFPTIKFFPRGKAVDTASAQEYNSARTAEKFLEYLKEQIEKDKGFARVEELDHVAKKFAGAADKSAVIKEAQEIVGKLGADVKPNGELYVKFMEKASEKGAQYLTREKARLERMLGTGSVHASKVDEMTRKSSVLGAFVDEE